MKARDDLRSVLRSNDGVLSTKLRRIVKDLKKLEAANGGNTKAFAYILDLAYGRRGKLKWELLEPFLQDAKRPGHPRIIPTVEKSRPPVYTSEIAALLTSSFARKGKPLSLENLRSPPTLPPRADPGSEDAVLMGPFSKRREVNIRWRYFTSETRKLLPPLKIGLNDAEHGQINQASGDIFSAGKRGLGLQGQRIHEDIELIAGHPRSLGRPFKNELSNAKASLSYPSRWLRRRYQDLTRRLPILSFSKHDEMSSGKYSVSISSTAMVPCLRSIRKLGGSVTHEDRQWLKLGVRDK